MANAPNTNIIIPYSPFLNNDTGRPNQEWLQWLMNPSFITLNLGSALPVTSGGTGLTTIPTNGQLLIGNGTGYTLNPLTAGTGIGITNGAGTIAVSNTGVLSFAGGPTGLTPIAATTGNISLAGTLLPAYGGTGINSYVVGDLIYASATTTLSKLSDVATGNALISGGVTTAPSWGKIGLTTHVSGILPIANGGTNNNATPIAGAIAYGSGTTYAFTAAGVAGQVLTSAGAGTPTWAAAATGTVTSVSVVSANGFAGTVATSTTTPAITLSTTVTGLVKGNGTTLSAATAATDYVAPSAYASANGLTMATSRLLGRTTATTGAAEEISVAGGLTLSAGTLTGTSGTVTTVSFTGGIITVANPTTTPAFTVAGTSGGIPYFSSASTWASSGVLAASSLVVGGGAGATPATVTTGTGVVTALGVNTGSAGAFVVNGGALGTPSSGTVTNLTGTAGINITGTAPAGTLTGATLSSGVTASSLTSVGTSLTINSISVTPAEGTWVPTDASGASLSFSGVYALGKYKKVGAIVWFSFQVAYPATASAAAATIGGLPFTPANTGPDNVTGAMQTNGSTAALLTVNQNSATIALQIASTGIQFTNVQLSTIFVRGSGFYFTT